MTLGRTNCTILLVDDEAAGTDLRQRVLASNGFRVLTASDPEEAMSLFQTSDIDIVITDHLLGRATAAGLAYSMKRFKPYVPIVSLSGTTNVDEALKYADYFIGKAEGPETLLSAIDRILLEMSQRRTTVASTTNTPPPADPSTVQALLAAIVEDSEDAILSKTLDGVVLSWNHAAERMYGYTADEIVGQSIATILPADRPDEVNHILRRIRHGERITHYETLRRTKDGRLLEVALTISPIYDSTGQLMGASTIARDITDIKKAEDALRKAEKLALAGRMATTVAHEINNPLEAIGNILFLLRNTVQLSDEARTLVNTAYDELKRVSDITKLTLGMQRGNSDRREAISVTNLLDNVLSLYERRTANLKIDVQKRYGYKDNIIGSPGELRQVFSNLVVNAIDALNISGDKLIISTRPSRRWDTGQEGVRVTIGDNGPGIPQANRKQIFQAFYTTKGEQGTGIGLWVTRGIVRSHGGKLEMHSSTTPGHNGTCFSVFLPFQGPNGKA